VIKSTLQPVEECVGQSRIVSGFSVGSA